MSAGLFGLPYVKVLLEKMGSKDRRKCHTQSNRLSHASQCPLAPWGHQAVRSCLESSFYSLDDLSIKTDEWHLYECCFSSPWNKTDYHLRGTFPWLKSVGGEQIRLPPPLHIPSTQERGGNKPVYHIRCTFPRAILKKNHAFSNLRTLHPKS